MGGNGFNPARQQAAFEEDTVLTLETLKTNVGAKPDYLPLIAAAGVLFLQANDIAQLYL